MPILEHQALPLGVQLIPAPYKEASILQVTAVLEPQGLFLGIS